MTTDLNFLKIIDRVKSQLYCIGHIVHCRRLRALMIDALCSYGDQECLNEASAVFARWMKNPDGSGKYERILIYSIMINYFSYI